VTQSAPGSPLARLKNHDLNGSYKIIYVKNFEDRQLTYDLFSPFLRNGGIIDKILKNKKFKKI
jgi:hypothetical protein